MRIMSRTYKSGKDLPNGLPDIWQICVLSGFKRISKNGRLFVPMLETWTGHSSAVWFQWFNLLMTFSQCSIKFEVTVSGNAQYINFHKKTIEIQQCPCFLETIITVKISIKNSPNERQGKTFYDWHLIFSPSNFYHDHFWKWKKKLFYMINYFLKWDETVILYH